jgi:hypothetical protein
VENFLRHQAVETKHGRFSLLASFGDLVREHTKLGSYLSPYIGVKFLHAERLALDRGLDRVVPRPPRQSGRVARDSTFVSISNTRW